MPAAGGSPRHGTCRSVERSSVMVVAVVIGHNLPQLRHFARIVPAAMSQSNRIYLFDTTLRDGAQTQGVDFTVADKRQIALALDSLGLDYIEGGWPGANPTDT